MHLLYVRADNDQSDTSTIYQLERLSSGTTVRPVEGVDAAIGILRSNNNAFGDRFEGVVTSPGLDDAGLVSLVNEIWLRGPIVTLISVVLDLAHSLRAFDAGADAVLLLVNGTLSNPRETLEGLERRSRPVAEAEPGSAAGPVETTSTGAGLVDLSTLKKYFAKPAVRGPVTVAVATGVDEALVEGVARLVHQLSPTEPVPGPTELDEIIRAAGSTMIVARDDRGIVGMLTLHTFRAATGIHAWIQDLVVDAEAKGRGVSELLTREAVRVGIEQGARTAELTSRPSHLGNARLYERIGFQRRQTHLYRYRMLG